MLKSIDEEIKVRELTDLATKYDCQTLIHIPNEERNNFWQKLELLNPEKILAGPIFCKEQDGGFICHYTAYVLNENGTKIYFFFRF